MDDTVKTPAPSLMVSRWSSFVPYIVLAAAFILIAYYGTAVYNFFIPTVVQRRDFSLGIWLLAAVGGVAAFLSPCAFGMLPAYFGFFLAMDSSGREGSGARRALRYGLAAAAGMVTIAVVLAVVILIAGATFAPGLRVVTTTPNPYTRVLRIAAGVLLVVLGIFQWRGRSLGSSLRSGLGTLRQRAFTLKATSTSPTLLFYEYGLLYVLVALPCVANVMAAPMLAAIATQGIGGLIVTEAVFLLTMATLMVITSVLIGVANQTVLARMRQSLPSVLRAASVLLIIMGLTLIYLDLDLASFRRIFFHFPIR